MHIFYTPNSRQEKEPPGGGPFPVINQRKGVRGYGTPGAGDGNWTHVLSLEGWCTSRCTTPADRRGQLIYHVGSCISSRTTDKAHPIYAITDFLCSIDLVQVGGLEPPRYEPQEPKSWVSANSTIPACWMVSPELHWCRETSYGIILLRQNLSLKEGDTPQGCETWFRYIFYRRAYIWTMHWWLLRGSNPDLLDWCPSWSTFELRSHMAGILGFEPRL